MGQQGHEIDVFNYLDFRRYLADLYIKKKSSSKRYSYEQFSQDCGFGKTPYLYLIIHGARNLNEKSAKGICAHIPLRKERRKYFIALVAYDNANSGHELDSAFSQVLNLRAESTGDIRHRFLLEYFSEWYHAAIREFVTFRNFRPDPDWIASNLQPKIRPEQAAHSLELLQKIGYIKFDFKTNRWHQSESVIETEGQVAQLSVARYHQQMLEAAKESLIRDPAAKREYGAMTISIAKAQFPLIKNRLRAFQQEIIESFGDNEGVSEEVVQLNFQLFHLIKDANDESK